MPMKKSTDESRALEEAQELAAQAEQAGLRRCSYKGEALFFMPYEKALVPGHVYSEAGRREVGITGMCEFHFDEITTFDEDD